MRETAQENQQLFDADAEQRVELTLTRNDAAGKQRKSRVAHIFRAMTDEEFFKYEERKRIVQKISGGDILNVRTEDKNLSAAEWLWNTLAVGREGYVEREDWKAKTNLFDKQKAVEQGLLAVFVVAENQSDDIFADAESEVQAISDEDFLDEPFEDDAQSSVCLDCLFNGCALTTTHFFSEPSAADVGEYDRLMRKATNQIDGRRGLRQKKGQQVAQVAIPSKARELCMLYDRLIIGTNGYAGRVPPHHKREAVLELLARDSDVTEKN